MVFVQIAADTARRLALIRMLVSDASENCKAPEPLSARGLLGLHDSIELFCVLALEHTGAPVAEREHLPFLRYWDRLLDSTGIDLGQKATMSRLNKARVSFKHYGTMPSRFDLESFANAAREFFIRNTSVVFSLQFESLSLIDLVSMPPVRDLLHEAERELADGDVHGSLVACAAAFIELRREYRQLRWGRGWSPLDITLPSFSTSDSSELASDVESFAGEVEAAIDTVDDAVEALALGLDAERLIQFRLFWPHVRQEEDGSWADNSLLRQVRQPVPPSLAQESIDLVVECALVLQRRL